MTLGESDVSEEESQLASTEATPTNIKDEGEGDEEELAAEAGQAGKYSPATSKGNGNEGGDESSFNIKEDKLADELDALPDPKKVSVGMAELNDNLKSVATVSDMKVTENGDLEITYTPNMTGGKRKTKRRKNMKKNKSQKKKRKQTKKKGGKKAKKANTRKCA